MPVRCVGGILARVPHVGPLPKTPMIRYPRTRRSFAVLLIVNYLFETGTSSIQGYVRPLAPPIEMAHYSGHSGRVPTPNPLSKDPTER